MLEEKIYGHLEYSSNLLLPRYFLFKVKEHILKIFKTKIFLLKIKFGDKLAA